MKKKYGEDDSENEFSVDEPEELQESDDDWTPAASEGTGRRQSRRVRASAGVKKQRLAELTSSSDSAMDSDDSTSRKKKKGRTSNQSKYGRGRPRKTMVTSTTPKLDENVSTTTSMNSVGAPVEKEFTSGAFVVLKSDFQTGGDPPIWKIDGKALLQKYVPFEQDGKTLYRNTSTYSGWTVTNKELYYPAPIIFKMQNRKETIIEFVKSSIKVDDSD